MNRFLTNVQRKQLHDRLIQASVDPNVTKWSNAKMGWTNSDCETLHAGLCHFLISPDGDGEFTVNFMPSWDGGGKRGLIDQPWKSVLETFDFWAHKVKEELEQPDPWGSYALAAFGTTPEHEKDNAPFTHAEAEHVEKSIQLFIQHVKSDVPEFAAVEDQFKPQFERLAKQAKAGAGRIDWKNQFVGLLVNLFVALSLAPEQAAALWSFWAQLINNMLLP